MKIEDETRLIADMFDIMSRMCLNIEEEVILNNIDKDNLKWGIEIETKSKKYQLVLELKEVEK